MGRLANGFFANNEMNFSLEFLISNIGRFLKTRNQINEIEKKIEEQVNRIKFLEDQDPTFFLRNEEDNILHQFLSQKDKKEKEIIQLLQKCYERQDVELLTCCRKIEGLQDELRHLDPSAKEFIKHPVGSRIVKRANNLQNWAKSPIRQKLAGWLVELNEKEETALGKCMSDEEEEKVEKRFEIRRDLVRFLQEILN